VEIFMPTGIALASQDYILHFEKSFRDPSKSSPTAHASVQSVATAGGASPPANPPSAATSRQSEAPGQQSASTDTANQIIGSLGSDGVLNLAEVENDEDGTDGVPTLRSNSYTVIAADFERISSESTTMTAAQLTRALQPQLDSWA
jgi:hypothetical protein